jgi:hypothetical protein
MGVNDVTLEELCTWGGACARCGQPVLDLFRAVIQLASAVPLPMWLQLMSSAARAERGVATEAVSGAKGADGGC